MVGLTGWLSDIPAPSDYFLPVLTCRSFYQDPASTSNLAEFCDPHADKLASQAQAAQQTGPAAARSLWAQVDRVVTPSGAKAGKAYISCTTATASVSLCHAAYVLKGGQIDAQVAVPDTATRYTLAVTGGTGIYAGVTGQARSVETGPRTANRTFRLIRPGQS